MAKNVYRKKGSPYYEYDFWVAGVRYRASTGCTTEREAEKVAKKLKQQAKSVAFGQPVAVEPRALSPCLIGEVAVQYAEATKDILAGWRNIQRDLVRIVSFFESLVADEDGNPIKPVTDPTFKRAVQVESLSDIRDGHVKLMVQHRRKDRVIKKGNKKPLDQLPFVQPGTVNHTIVRLQALFAFAKDELKLKFEHEPNWAKHKLACIRKNPRIFVQDEKSRFDKATTNESFEPIFAFAKESSKREHYCATLEWSHVHWESGVIEKPGKRKPGGEEKIEKVSITPEIRAILEPLIGHHPIHVFTYVAQRDRNSDNPTKVRIKGQRYPISASYLATEFKRTMKRAKIENFGFHSLRRSGATEFYNANRNDLLLTQRFLGHASPETTAKYILRDDHDVHKGMVKRAKKRAADAKSKQQVPTIVPTPRRKSVA